MKIAVLSFSNPFVDKQDGGKIDIMNRLRILKEIGIEIDHFSIIKKNEKKLNEGTICKTYDADVVNRVKYFFDKYPISVSNRWNINLATQLIENKYDVYILENFNMVKYLEYIPKDSKIVLRVHNIESCSRYELFKSNPFKIKSILELIESIKYSNVERRFLDRIDKFLFISKDEKKYFEIKYPQFNEKFEWLPPVCNFNDDINIKIGNGNFILYYGDLTVSHNIIGIKKFIKNVFNKLYLNRNIKLKISGKVNKKDKEYLEKINGIEVLGYVDDLDSIIKKAKFIVAPIYTGAGVKIKVIHSISKGKIVITTPKGIEGTGLIKNLNIMSADTYEDYYNYCIDTLDNKSYTVEISKKAYEYVKKYYSKQYQILKLNQILI